jgi:hypothetical protein
VLLVAVIVASRMSENKHLTLERMQRRVDKARAQSAVAQAENAMQSPMTGSAVKKSTRVGQRHARPSRQEVPAPPPPVRAAAAAGSTPTSRLAPPAASLRSQSIVAALNAPSSKSKHSTKQAPAN